MNFSEMEKRVFALQAAGMQIPVDGKDPFPLKVWQALHGVREATVSRSFKKHQIGEYSL